MVGVTRQMQAVTKLGSHHFKIVLLQGENDGFSLANAKEAIAGVFGRSGYWRVLEDEGHSPRQRYSRALITAAIDQALSMPIDTHERNLADGSVAHP